MANIDKMASGMQNFLDDAENDEYDLAARIVSGHKAICFGLACIATELQHIQEQLKKNAEGT